MTKIQSQSNSIPLYLQVKNKIKQEIRSGILKAGDKLDSEAEMQKEVLKEPTYVEELLTLFRSNLGKEELLEKISDYHESDIADAMEQMTMSEASRWIDKTILQYGRMKRFNRSDRNE